MVEDDELSRLDEVEDDELSLLDETGILLLFDVEEALLDVEDDEPLVPPSLPFDEDTPPSRPPEQAGEVVTEDDDAPPDPFVDPPLSPASTNGMTEADAPQPATKHAATNTDSFNVLTLPPLPK